MPGNIFLDTNIFLYALLKDDSKKRDKAIALLENISENTPVIINTQIINEIYNVLHSKYKFEHSIIQNKLKVIIENSLVQTVTANTIFLCWQLMPKYNYSYFDTLILASALENNCKILYSEDLHHEQIIEKQLKIINPFK